MIPPQPAHYALSEAGLALVTAWTVWRLMPRERMAAWALVPFGLAALIGAVRLAAGITGPIIEIHQFVSRTGGLFGLAILVAVLAGLHDWRALACGVAAAALALTIPAIAQPLFVALIIAGMALAGRRAPENSALAAAGFSILLAAQLVSSGLRPAQPALAWHLFHVLVAVWVLAIGAVFRPRTA